MYKYRTYISWYSHWISSYRWFFPPQRCAPQHPVSVEHSRSTPTIALRVLKPIAEGSRTATFLAPTFSAMCVELGNRVSLGELSHFLRKCCHSWLNFSGELWSNLSTVGCLLFYKFMDITYRTYLHHGGVRERLTMKEKNLGGRLCVSGGPTKFYFIRNGQFWTPPPNWSPGPPSWPWLLQKPVG
jgi:hypothetical protein